MNSTLKYVLPLGALVAVVFVATLISQNVGDQSIGDPDPNEFKLTGPPLYFTHEAIAFDPASEDMVLRSFQGFYEVGPTKILVPYWFKNPHPVPVRIAVLGRSCTSCSTVRIATFSEADTRTCFQRTAAGTLPASPLAPPSLVTGLSVLAMMESAKTQDFDFERPDDKIEVPAAVNPDTPTWGMLILGVEVRQIGRKDLRADFSFAAGNTPPINKAFFVVVVGSEPFEVVPKQIKFDDLPEGAEPQSKEIYYWSSTRGMPTPGREGWPTLNPPTLTLTGSDPFLTVGTPVPLTDAEMARSPMQQGQGGSPYRVLGAYRIPITISRKVAGPQPGTIIEPDIGPYESSIGITTLGTPASQQVKIQGNMTGLVALRGNAQIVDMGSLRDSGKRVPATLVSDRKDITLEALPKESKPDFLNVTIKDKTVEGGRIYWPFEVEIKPGVLSGDLPPDSVVVFKITTPTGERKIRIPVKGRAYR